MSESGDSISEDVHAANAKYAVAIARGRGRIPLDLPASVKHTEYMGTNYYRETGEVVFEAEPTDKSQLIIDLLLVNTDYEGSAHLFWTVVKAVIMATVIIVAASLAIAFLFGILQY